MLNTSSEKNGTLMNGNASHSTLTQGLLLQFALVLVLIGNVLVLLALRSYKRWTPPDVLISSLSTADILDSLIGLQVLVIMNYYLDATWERWICESYLTFLYTFRFASATTVTCMAAERAVLIVSPIKHRTMVTTERTKKILLVTWLFCLLLSVLPLIGFGHSGYQQESKKCLVQLFDFGLSYAVFIEVYGHFLLALTLGSYVIIKLSAKRFVRRQESLGAYKRHKISDVGNPMKLDRKVTGGVNAVQRFDSMMAMVVLVYYISWLPFLFNNLSSIITGKEPDPKVSLVAGLMSLLHALVNPVLYGKMSQRYRRGYLQVVKTILIVCGGKRPVSLDKESQTVLCRIYKADEPLPSCADNLGFSSDHRVVPSRKNTNDTDLALELDVRSILDGIIATTVKKIDDEG